MYDIVQLRLGSGLVEVEYRETDLYFWSDLYESFFYETSPLVIPDSSAGGMRDVCIYCILYIV